MKSAFKHASAFCVRELYQRCRERLAHQFNTDDKISTRHLQSREKAKGACFEIKEIYLQLKGNLLAGKRKGHCRQETGETVYQKSAFKNASAFAIGSLAGGSHCLF